MMGGMVSMVRSLWNGWSSNCAESETAQVENTQFVKDVTSAIKAGDLDKLQHLQAKAATMMYGGLEYVHTTPSLIHCAASHGHEDIVSFLIDLGVDVDETDTCGMSALHEACKTKHHSCVRLLVGRTRNIDLRDVWGRTPLIKALVYRNTEAAELLLEKGANPNAVDIYGITPLSTVIDYNQEDMLKTLVRHGADVNLITQHMYKCSGPPLYQAINNHNVALVNVLIQLGATTQPQQHHYSNNPSAAGGISWQYLTSSNTAPLHTLPHPDAVIMAMVELVKRGQNTIDVSGPSMEILMALLAAHGYPLGSSPDILIRVLINSKLDDFSMLLNKVQVCTSSSQGNLFATLGEDQRTPDRPQHLEQMAQHLRGNNNGKKPPRAVMSLQNQARRVARQAMMASGRNVMWATKRLQCPPALKSLLLLKDIDRAFAPLLLSKPVAPL